MKTAPYAGKGTPDGGSDSVPIPSPGIGTRISDMAKSIGTRPEVANLMGVSPAQLQRYIREENMPPFDAAARLCQKAGRSLEWLATGVDSASLRPLVTADESAHYASQSVSDEALNIALEMADKAIGDGYLPRPRYAKLVRLLYEGVTQGLPVAEVLQLAQRASRLLATGDAVDDGQQEVGKPGRAAAR